METNAVMDNRITINDDNVLPMITINDDNVLPMMTMKIMASHLFPMIM